MCLLASNVSSNVLPVSLAPPLSVPARSDDPNGESHKGNDHGEANAANDGDLLLILALLKYVLNNLSGCSKIISNGIFNQIKSIIQKLIYNQNKIS
jgi:hypothetical protein